MKPIFDDDQDKDELFNILCVMPQIKVGSFALIMENEELKRTEEQHLNLYDVFNDPGMDCGEHHYERYSEVYGENPMYDDNDCWEEESRSKSSRMNRASKVFHSLRAASSSFGPGNTESIASSMKKKRSLVTEYLDSKLQRKTSSTSSAFSTASAREAFALRVARVKVRLFRDKVARKE